MLIGLDPESQNIPGVVAQLEVDPDLIFLYVQSLGVGCVVGDHVTIILP